MKETASPDYRFTGTKQTINILNYLIVAAVCFILTSWTGSMLPGMSNTPQCQINCVVGFGVHGAQVFVEPDDVERLITNAISNAHRSIWLEIYILSHLTVIRTL